MLWAVERTVSLRWLFYAPKSHVSTDGKDINFMFIFVVVYLGLINYLCCNVNLLYVMKCYCKAAKMDFCCFYCCWLLLPLQDSVIVLCFAVRYFVSILVLQSSLVALLCLSCWCLIIVVWLFLTVPSICLQFVIVVFPNHTHYFGETANWLPISYCL